ncbi:MAG TPA: leucyl aminopeptidase [Actinomycetota bacterium]|nr:leucyl aminopeptidase [Actinomycetota bacterium]
MARFEFRSASAASVAADLLVLPVFEGPEPGPGVAEVDEVLGTELVSLLRSEGLRGRARDSLLVPTLGRAPAGAVLLTGLGPRDRVSPDTVRRATGRIAARAARYRRVATTVPQAVEGGLPEAIQAFVEGLLLGAYRFDRYKGSNDEEPHRLERVAILGARADAAAARRGIRRGEIYAEATSFARDLVNTPAIDATPEFLARTARAMAREVRLECKVWGKAELERGGFGGILGVGRGSGNPPRLIELRYRGGSGAPVALSGKGITFDSGGLSIKDAKGMEWMKADMAGAASVLGAMRAIARLEPRVNVIAAIPSSENMPGGTAIRPGDVLRHRGGKTSEVLNTDAEGRLILADALALLAERKPRAVIDVATLTGACMIALGEDLWGVMGTDDRVVDDLLAAGESAGEPGWRLPLWAPYRHQIESSVADVKNVGNRWGGAITAALFLKEFVGDLPWAHIDIAGTAFSERAGDYWPKGATGNPVRTLIGFVERQAERGRARR